MRADDPLHGRTPDATAGTRVDLRGGPEVLGALAASFAPAEPDALPRAVVALLSLYRAQVAALHDAFRLERPLADDLLAIDIAARVATPDAP